MECVHEKRDVFASNTQVVYKSGSNIAGVCLSRLSVAMESCRLDRMCLVMLTCRKMDASCERAWHSILVFIGADESPVRRNTPGVCAARVTCALRGGTGAFQITEGAWVFRLWRLLHASRTSDSEIGGKAD